MRDESAGLVMERLRVRVPAEAAGEVSSPALTFCADSNLPANPVKDFSVKQYTTCSKFLKCYLFYLQDRIFYGSQSSSRHIRYLE